MANSTRAADVWDSDSEDDEESSGMDDEEFNRRLNDYHARLTSRSRSNNSFSEGFNGNTTHLSDITCDFCEPIIQFLYNFRLQEEEDFLEQIPQCYKIKEDDIGALTLRSDSCKVCETVCSAIVEEVCDKPNSRLLKDDAEPRDYEICWEFNHSFADPRPVLCVGNGSLSVYFKFRGSLACFLEKAPRPESESVAKDGQISYEVLYRWYEQCLGHGGTLQDEHIVSDMLSTTIRLVDVNDYRICDASTREPYLALSYVWGASLNDDDKLTTANLPLLYREHALESQFGVSATVRDAMEVTRELGFRYLFVDRLCIIQDSSDDKAIYVTAMHEIYNKAQITIVAAGGPSAHWGLPGTSGTPRASTSLLHAARQCTSVDPAHDFVQVYMDEFPTSELMEKQLRTSAWATRGWTYQEDKLSDRCLIFTDQAVFWKCRHLCLYENCPYEQNEMLSTNLQDMASSDPFGRSVFWWTTKRMMRGREAGSSDSERISVGEDGRAQKVRVEFNDVAYDKKRDLPANVALRSRIQEFSERKLTYQDDVANAFRGMIEAFKLIYHPLPIHHGMFARSLPADLLWACTGCVYSAPDHTHLAKRDCCDSMGLPVFPSWSWLAWQGQPSWDYGTRQYDDHFGEMDEPLAMTSSIYGGILHPPITTRIYQETRRIGWSIDAREPVPPRWMTRHTLWDRAITFAALGFRSNWRLEGRLKSGPFRKLGDLGLRGSAMSDVDIVQWLQMPSETAFEQQVNIICLSNTTSFLLYWETVSLAVMMLISYRMVDGHEVAFREGLFTCKAPDLNASMEERRIFLC